ncbi:hypothetical protein SETIT_9G113700v2 [Setaria italica]|uniref:Uncharacterized protein n=1 Tax=Setaria italica TaxID=4555 RepID=A0A368SFF4_SETIT|nr:hypothetical protein SETIT_9G113700v2 [Setaria italica]
MLRRWDRGRRDPPKEAPGHGAGGWTKAARHRWRLRESSSSGSGPRVCKWIREIIKQYSLVSQTGDWGNQILEEMDLDKGWLTLRLCKGKHLQLHGEPNRK